MCNVLDKNSLSMTLWNLERTRLKGEKTDPKEISETLSWIAKRQKDPGRYGLGFAAPTEMDYTSSTL
ncbi:MAG: hypothetical protein ACP5G4_10625, partial [bacterium]